MDRDEIRLEILDIVVPQATKNDLRNPDNIIEIAEKLEKYVMKDYSSSKPVIKKKVTSKKKAKDNLPDYLSDPE